MNNLICVSPSDILVEFDNGPFANSIPLKRLLFERSIARDELLGIKCTKINGIFDVGSEYLNSCGQNVLDNLLTGEIVFNVKNVDRQNTELKSHVYDELQNLIIYKTRTIIPQIGSIVTKRYYFTSKDEVGPTDINVPNDDVQEVRVLNTININDENRMSNEELSSKIKDIIRNMIQVR